MRMEYGCKFRIYPSRKQEPQIKQTFGCCRSLYNRFLDERIKAHKDKKPSPSKYDQMREIPQLKRDHDWLKEIDSTAFQAVADNVDAAFQNFFRREKEGKGNPGYQKFKKKRDKKRSYKSKRVDANIKVLPGAVQFPKVPGAVKCRVSRPVEGRILSATVSQVPSGEYYISLCCRTADVKSKLLPKTGRAIGIDMGITSYAVSSDGDKYPNHKYLARAQKRLSPAQKRLSRLPADCASAHNQPTYGGGYAESPAAKSRGSKNREKARIAVAVLHEKVSNKRRDTIHKLTAKLVRENDIICIEDLSVKNMMKNHHLAKSISDAAWYEFRRQLEYKAAWRGKRVIVIDRFYPSSRTCSECGHVWSGTKKLSVREWTCPHCGARHDRDINAAKNILKEGLRQAATAAA